MRKVHSHYDFPEIPPPPLPRQKNEIHFINWAAPQAAQLTTVQYQSGDSLRRRRIWTSASKQDIVVRHLELERFHLRPDPRDVVDSKCTRFQFSTPIHQTRPIQNNPP